MQRGRPESSDRQIPATNLSGFTLIELLVVIATIALLVAILVPSLQGAMATARRVRCSTQLRQWSLAASTYAMDYRGYLPRRGQGVQPTMKIERPDDWFNALPPKMSLERFVDRVGAGRPPKPQEESLWVCPVATATTHQYFFSYAMNMMLSTWWEPEPDRIDNVGPLQTMVFMADAPGSHCSTLPSYEPYSPVARHRGFVNIAFLDGHVTSHRGEEVGCGVGDPHRYNLRWVVPGRSWPEPGQP